MSETEIETQQDLYFRELNTSEPESEQKAQERRDYYEDAQREKAAKGE